MKVLLAGAAGNLGVCVFRLLIQAGYDVVATDIRSAADLPGACIQADLLDMQAVRSLMDGCDAVVHTGNHKCAREDVPPEKTYLENVAMNTHVFLAAEDAGVGCLVFTSSIQVISGDRHVNNLDEPSCLTRLPLDGQAPPRPGNTYALSKLAGEQMLRYQAFSHPDHSYTAIRFPWLLGRREDGHAKRSGPIKHGWLTNADEAYACLSMADAAGLILAVLKKQLPGYHQYLPAAGNSLGLTPAQMIVQYYPHVPLKAVADSLPSLFDMSEIESYLGWAPREVDLFSRRHEPS